MTEGITRFLIILAGITAAYAIIAATEPSAPAVAPAMAEKRESCDELNDSFAQTDSLVQRHLDNLWNPEKSTAIGSYERYLMSRDDNIRIAENCLADLRAVKSPKAKPLAKVLETLVKEQVKARHNQIMHLRAWQQRYE